MNSISMRLLALPSILSVALLTACGGGGGGENDSGSGPGPIRQADSRDCFNSGLYKPGTSIEFERLDKPDQTIGFPAIWEVTPYAATAKTPAMSKVTTAFNSASLYLVDQDALLEYGIIFNDSIGFSTPPFRRPIQMEAGEVQHQVVTTNHYINDDSGTLESSTTTVHDRTYIGREVIETPMGSIETCKFEVKQYSTYSDPNIKPKHITKTHWHAAKPPYQGFLLQSRFVVQPDGEAVTQDEFSRVSKINKYDVK